MTNEPQDVDDSQGVNIRDHIMIRDPDTQEVIINQSVSSQKPNEGWYD